MAKKIQLQDANGNVLHPLTLGECVTMDNGENLDTLMSKSQMFTPTITQDKSMFKVGTGVDVDYSANVKDGAYESLVFKGKSLVNLFDKSKVSPDHTSYTLGSDNTITYVANNGFTDGVKLNHLKPNTKYALFFDVLTVPQEPNIPYRINDDGTNYNINIFGTGQDNPTSGFHSFTTGNDVSDLKFFFYTNLRNVGFKLTLPVIIEYQEGMENWDIPYFDGIGYAKMPILRNVGKNLIDGNGDYIGLSGGWGATSTNVLTGDGTLKRYSYIVKCKPNTTYTLTTDGTANRCGLGEFAKYPQKGVVGTKWGTDSGCGTLTITTKSDTQYLVCYSYYRETVHTQSEMDEIVRGLKTQLEESPTQTTYEDHKTNILRTSEEIVLREVDGVQDTYNVRTGEYVKRIGEIVLDGSEGWGGSGLENQEETLIFQYNVSSNQNIPNPKPSSLPICDKFASNRRTEDDAEGILRFNGTNGHGFYIRIQKSRLSTPDYIGFKQWLSQNPITVQYELEAPVTTIVKPSTMTPFAYQNGHVIVESGFEGQSLLPEIEYSVVTGRTGQVTQNTKVLRQQEQQIIGLEELLLTQVVQMEYERTLLQFDYELQMMMLG